MIAVVTLSTLAATSTTQAQVTQTPARCTERNAPVLCSIHFHKDRTNHLRNRMGLARIPYHWLAEKHPARRTAILKYWSAVHDKTISKYKLFVSTSTCYGAMHYYFPSYAWSSAKGIIDRESGGSTYAKNPGSSASGCFQLIDFWWDGSSSYGWVFNPFSARENVYHSYLLWLKAHQSFCPGQWCL